MTEAERQRIIRLKLCRLAGRPGAPPEAISSGFDAIDAVLGIGGFPRGRIVELSGPEACGKTTLALRTIAGVQRRGGTAALIDADRTFDPHRAAALGIHLENLVMSAPEWGEQALEIARSLASSGAVDLIVVDSAAALVPKLELETSLETISPGLHAAVLLRALRRLAPAAARSGACVVFLNQLRSAGAGEAAETTAGGRALKAYAAVRAELRPLASPGKVRFRVLKNKFAAAPAEAEVDIG